VRRRGLPEEHRESREKWRLDASNPQYEKTKEEEEEEVTTIMLKKKRRKKKKKFAFETVKE
jgi:hypothetical protein